MRSLTAVAAAILLASPVLAQEQAVFSCRFVDSIYELVEGDDAEVAELQFWPASTISLA